MLWCKNENFKWKLNVKTCFFSSKGSLRPIRFPIEFQAQRCSAISRRWSLSGRRRSSSCLGRLQRWFTGINLFIYFVFPTKSSFHISPAVTPLPTIMIYLVFQTPPIPQSTHQSPRNCAKSVASIWTISLPVSCNRSSLCRKWQTMQQPLSNRTPHHPHPNRRQFSCAKRHRPDEIWCSVICLNCVEALYIPIRIRWSMGALQLDGRAMSVGLPSVWCLYVYDRFDNFQF